MTIRKIVNINEEKCNGCGLCIPNCAEGALQIINGKAKLISDEFCDGLGACLGHCPQNAITVIERQADEFNEEAVKKNLNLKTKNIHSLNQEQSGCTCPGSVVATHGSGCGALTGVPGPSNAPTRTGGRWKPYGICASRPTSGAG